jgi:hypothetical protein
VYTEILKTVKRCEAILYSVPFSIKNFTIYMYSILYTPIFKAQISGSPVLRAPVRNCGFAKSHAHAFGFQHAGMPHKISTRAGQKPASAHE